MEITFTTTITTKNSIDDIRRQAQQLEITPEQLFKETMQATFDNSMNDANTKAIVCEVIIKE